MKKRRVRFTHFEVRRGSVVQLKISVADEVVPEVSEELGALLRRIAPGDLGTPPSPETVVEDQVVIDQEHPTDDEAYHATLRAQLTGMLSSLCDTSLDDIVEIARIERAKRAENNKN